MKPATLGAKLKLLLIEDSPGDARLLREYLAEAAGDPFELTHVDTLATGLEHLAQGGFALVLLDLSLPDCFGFDTFTKAHTAAPEVPIIVLSGRDDEALAIKTVHEGAQDYLVKGQADSRLLVRAVLYAIERKHAEEALSKERDLLHTLLNNLPDRIYFKDRKSRFIRISRAVMEQFKISHPREAMGKTDLDFFAPEHAQAALDDEKRVMQTGQPILGKIEREILADGNVTYALTSKMPLKDKQGRIVGNFGISRDITDIQRIKDTLAVERNLLRSLIDNLPDYIYVQDAEGRYKVDNIAHRRLLGVTSDDEVVGKTVFDFFPPELAGQYSRDDQEILRSGHALLNREEPVLDHAGNRRWNSTTKVPLRNDDGQVTGLVCISRDITERKLAEEQLQRTNDELERKKEQLQSTLGDLQHSHEELKAAQFQLIQAEKMQSVGRLAAGVAHEVKNPLGILSMGIEYLSKTLAPTDKNVPAILADMLDALKRADAIIMGLLDFSVPRALASQPEDMSAIVEQSVALVRHEITAKAITIERDLAENLPPVYLDKQKVTQVFVNLLTNAIHAMPERGTLTLRTYLRQLQPGEIERDDGSRLAGKFRSGDHVLVTEVIDTGSGIPEEKLAHIFDPFFTTKPTGKGTGLGLTVTKRIVELHGGSIDVRNRKEGGVIATILFKVRAGGEPAAVTPRQPWGT